MRRFRSLLIPGVDKQLLVQDAAKLLPDPARRRFISGGHGEPKIAQCGTRASMGRPRRRGRSLPLLGCTVGREATVGGADLARRVAPNRRASPG